MEHSGTATVCSGIQGEVFDCAELLDRIFANLKPVQSQLLPFHVTIQLLVPERQHLLRAALTCKTFLEPALDALWESMNSLIPLLKLLPSFQLISDTYVLRGHVSEADRARYHYYARRVREFIYSGESSQDRRIADHTKVRLAQIWRCPLLPALKRFICSDLDRSSLFIHSLFLSPTIQCVELKSISEEVDKAVGSLLSTMPYEVPLLQRLVLCDGLSKESLSYVTQLNNLQSLELLELGFIIDPQFIEKLASLPHLETLSLNLDGYEHSTFPAIGGFRALKHLTITARFPFVEDILTDISSELISFAVTGLPENGWTGDEDWTGDCTRLFTMITRRWQASCVSVTIDHSGHWYDSDVMPMTTLSPLFRLSNLEHLKVKRFDLPIVTDDEIHQFATAWPSLKSLHLPFKPDGSTLKPSLTSLYTLAKHCPSLRSLCIPLTTTSIPALPDDNVSVHYLWSLLIGNIVEPLRLQDSLLVARHIDRLFPQLQTLECQAGENANGTWSTIFTMIQTLRAVRVDDLDLYHNPKVVSR